MHYGIEVVTLGRYADPRLVVRLAQAAEVFASQSAVRTVKTHTNSIFSKLQVTSRTQAIARARDLQLL